MRAQKESGDTAQISTDSGSQVNGWTAGSGFKYERYDVTDLGTKTYAGLKTELAGAHSLPLLESGIRWELQTAAVYDGVYGEVFKGYFYAPVTGNYIFRGVCDDNFGLYISEEYGSVSVPATPYIYEDSYTPRSNAYNLFITNHTTAFGEEIAFEAGRYYYMEAYHLNTGGEGYMKIQV